MEGLTGMVLWCLEFSTCILETIFSLFKMKLNFELLRKFTFSLIRDGVDHKNKPWLRVYYRDKKLTHLGH